MPPWGPWPPRPNIWAGGSVAAAWEPKKLWKVPRSSGWDGSHWMGSLAEGDSLVQPGEVRKAPALEDTGLSLALQIPSCVD